MPNPTEISILNYNFEAKACNELLTAMLNHSDFDYVTVDELRHYSELSQFTFDELPSVEKSANRVTDGYNAEEVEYFTEVVRENLDYWHLGDWLCQDGRDGYAESYEIVGFIVDEICSPLCKAMSCSPMITFIISNAGMPVQ